jgi:hypothetical protein
MSTNAVTTSNTVTLSVTTPKKVGFVAKIEGDGEKLKAAVLKAMAEVDGVILPEAATLEPFVSALMNAAVPGSGNIAAVAENSLLALAKIIDEGGAVAESNLTNLGFDTTLITDAKALIPTLQAAVST